MKRFGSAAGNGGLREGKGSVSTESRALETYPYTFFSRYDEKPGTNPEELLGAAHAACFTMSFVKRLWCKDRKQGISDDPATLG
jgi:osmotically inducible protein OsmC